MACKMSNKLNDLMAMVHILFVGGDGEWWCEWSRTDGWWSIVRKKWVCDHFIHFYTDGILWRGLFASLDHGTDDVA